MPMLLPMFAATVLTFCTATDGDTLRCNGRSVRLLGIDAPELPGHCRRGRVCAPGDPRASKAALAIAAMAGPATLRHFNVDRYGRSVALVTVAGRDLSCQQLTTGRAIYKPLWDAPLGIQRTKPLPIAQRPLARICPAARG